MNRTPDFIERQSLRYDAEAESHQRHNQDRWTQQYRDRFIRSHLAEIPFRNGRVLDAMCASGVETAFMLGVGANVEGLDVSPRGAELYTQAWGRPCHVASIHATGLDDASFDVVYICGGLHHVKPLLAATVQEIDRILRPGGFFAFVEPNRDSWLQGLRDLWYRRSSRFEDEEEAISYGRELLPLMPAGFVERRVAFGGDVAYLLIGQSEAMGIPTWLKPLIAPLATAAERLLAFMHLSPRLFFVAVWQKSG